MWLGTGISLVTCTIKLSGNILKPTTRAVKIVDFNEIPCPLSVLNAFLSIWHIESTDYVKTLLHFIDTKNPTTGCQNQSFFKHNCIMVDLMTFFNLYCLAQLHHVRVFIGKHTLLPRGQFCKCTLAKFYYLPQKSYHGVRYLHVCCKFWLYLVRLM